MREGLAALVAGLALGMLVQEVTGVLTDEPTVYSKPEWYTVSRDGNQITYSAGGERYLECDHQAPLIASTRAAAGFEVRRRLIHRIDGTIIEDIDVPTEPRKFTAVGLWFKSPADSAATHFYVVVICSNPDYGVIEAEFGPMPMPVDGQTIVGGDPPASVDELINLSAAYLL